MRRSLTTALFFVLVAAMPVFGQSFFPCQNDPYTPSASTCREACVSCDLQDITDKNDIPIPTPLTIANCAVGGPAFTMENPRWYAFIANSTFLVFSIKLIDCQLGNGLEGAIFAACSQQLPGALSCASGGNPLIISAVNLTVGNRYFLVIDGVGGDVCNYQIDVISGSTVAPQLGPIGSISGLNQVCPKAKSTYSIPPVQNALAYTWTAPNGAKINGGTNTRTIPAPDGASVEIEFGSSSGIVCVTATNVCDTPLTTCMAVVNKALPVVDLAEKTVCYEELPYFWEEAPGTLVGAPGTYVLTSAPYPSYLGCDSVVRQRIIALPRKQKTLSPQWLCKDECFTINGADFCESGTYQEILTADDGCDSTVNFTLIKIPAHAGVNPTDTITCSVTSVLLSADSTITVGTAVDYRWIDSQGNTLSTSTTAMAPAPGTYYFIVSNYGGGRSCRDTAEVVVPGNLTPPTAHSGPSKVITCAHPQVQLEGSGSVGPQFTYQWTALIGGNIVSGATTLTPTVNAPGSYLLVVTDQHNGCTAVSVVVITAQSLPPMLSTTGGASTCTAPNVTLQPNTNAANPTYSWSGPNNFSATIPNPVVSIPGDYVLTVTDGNTGCTNSAIAVVTTNAEPPGATAVGDSLSCQNNTVTLLGSTAAANPQFAWIGPNGYTSPVANPTVTAPGIYVLTVTGGNGCTSTAAATVVQNPPVAANIAVTHISCFGLQDGSLTAAGNGGNGVFTYIWNTNDSTATIQNLGLGSYAVTVSDGHQCTATATAVIVQPPVLAANATATPMSGANTNDGSVQAAPTGGTAPYTYLWNTSDTTASVTNLGAGTYTVAVVDARGCAAVESVVILAGNCGISVNYETVKPLCHGEANGSITAVLSGGTGPFTFAWSSGGVNESEGFLAAGTYTLMITDSLNCDFTDTVTLAEPQPLVLAVESTVSPGCAGVPEGSATLAVSGGTGPKDILWSNGQTGPTLSDVEAGIYTATVTDFNTCTAELTVSIVANDQEPPVIANDSVMAPLGSAGNVTLTTATLSLDVTDNCAVSEVSFSPASFDCDQLGDHQVEVTAMDEAGNVTVDTITVTVVDNLPPSLLCPADIYQCVGDNTAQYAAPVATDNCLANGGIFNLVSGLPSGSVFPDGTTLNTYTYTDASGNVGACNFEVTILDSLHVALDTIMHDIDHQNIGSIILNVTGSQMPYTYQWFKNGVFLTTTNGPLTNIGEGAYVVIVSDNVGCTAVSDTFMVSSLVNTTAPDWAGGLLIVPNPTSGQLSVIFPDQFQEAAKLTIFDVTGNQVRQESALTPTRVNFDLSNLPNGLYTVLVQVDRQVIARKIVVSR